MAENQPPGVVPPDIELKLQTQKRLLERKEEIIEQYRRASQRSFMMFLRGLKIDGQKGPAVFESCIAEFQREAFESLAPNLEALRDGEMPALRRFWIERTKKASKDADLAVIVAWLCAFPVRPFYGQIGAADRDQAAIVRDRLSALLHLNPWLNDYILLRGNEIRSVATRPDGRPLCRFDIRSSEIAGAHGGTPDLLIVNELSHIRKWEFVENLMDNADGVAQGLVIIATNAGFKGTKAHSWRINASSSEEWGFFCLDRPAPWHSRATIDQARRRNPKSRYLRLWRGVWVSGKGDALNEEDIDPIFTLSGPLDNPEEGWIYFGGLDLGVKKDHSAFVVLGVNEEIGRIKLAHFRAWDPKEAKNEEVDLRQGEDHVLMVCLHFNVLTTFYDPFQAKLLAQRLETKISVEEMSFQSSSNLNQMASDFLQVVKAGIIDCYDDADFRVRGDFGKFNIVEKPYGYKLEAVSDESGHADVGTALLIALPACVSYLRGSQGLKPSDDLTDTSKGPLSREEIEELPKELRAIYDLD